MKITQISLFGFLLTLTACEVPTWLQGGLETLVYAVAGLLATLVSLLGLKLSAYFSTKTKSDKANSALSVLNDLLVSLVQALVEGYKEKLVLALKDGKIDAQEKEELKKLALDIIKSRLTTDYVKKLASTLGLTPQAAEQFIADKVIGMLGIHMEDLPIKVLSNRSAFKVAGVKVKKPRAKKVVVAAVTPVNTQ